MKSKASGGLVRFASGTTGAANDDQAADTVVELNKRTDATAGWDPYEVWRTRVKAVRDTRNSDPSEKHKR